jgi:hypothetical protein
MCWWHLICELLYRLRTPHAPPNTTSTTSKIRLSGFNIPCGRRGHFSKSPPKLPQPFNITVLIVLTGAAQYRMLFRVCFCFLVGVYLTVVEFSNIEMRDVSRFSDSCCPETRLACLRTQMVLELGGLGHLAFWDRS